MRSAALAAAAIAVASALPPGARQPDPFVPVAVEYTADPGTSPSTAADDLRLVRTVGFNSVAAVVRWRDAEPAPGQYAFTALERTLDAAQQAGLRVQVTLDNTPPSWLFDRYPDGRRVTADDGAAPRPENAACLDHPAVRAALQAFLAAASRVAARSPAFFEITAGAPAPSGFCLCSHTARRFAASVKESGADRENFVRVSLRDDLRWMITQTAPSYARSVASHARVPTVLQRAASAYPAQDDWMMSKVVDRYGVALGDLPAEPASLAMAFDDLAAATADRGWALHTRAPVGSTDLRFLTWLAFARGARTAAFDEVPADASFIGVITRNPALFHELRRVPAAVAILYDPQSATAEAQVTGAYAALFARNIAADLIHAGELSTAAATRYRAVVVPAALSASPSAAAALKELSSAGPMVLEAGERSALDEAAIARLAKAGVVPGARVSGGDGLVETRFLESAHVRMLIALNHSPRPARVTLTFTPETQEAIWQNMETGAGVSFVAGPAGPSYSYFFRPRDALVLMIRKDIR
jgi:hypothetical protein